MPQDRELINAIYGEGLTAQQVATMTGASPRRVRRRIRALAERLLSERFTFVVRHREAWPPTRRRVATACVLQGRTLRAAAKHLRISLHAVRKEMQIVGALHDAQPEPTAAMATPSGGDAQPRESSLREPNLRTGVRSSAASGLGREIGGSSIDRARPRFASTLR
jgi:hypothetical protein